MKISDSSKFSFVVCFLDANCKKCCWTGDIFMLYLQVYSHVNLLATDFFFQILAHLYLKCE